MAAKNYDVSFVFTLKGVTAETEKEALEAARITHGSYRPAAIKAQTVAVAKEVK